MAFMENTTVMVFLSLQEHQTSSGMSRPMLWIPHRPWARIWAIVATLASAF